MKFNILRTSILFLALWFSLTSTKKDPNNPPVGNTGAPGETTCGKSGCHTGGTFTGEVTIEGIPDTVLANTTYPITVKNTSNAIKAGFQLTCLTTANAYTGTLSTATGVSVGTQNSTGRKYARQGSPKTLANGVTSWTFNWKSPATLPDNKLTFYFSSLCANGDGGKNGDKVITSSKAVTLAATSAINEADVTAWLDFSFDNASKTMNIGLLQAAKGTIQIFDLQGKPVKSSDLSSSNTMTVNDLQSGVYVVKIVAGGKKFTKKVAVL
jgi:Secretion system C-terminal sorting domain